MGWLDQLQSPLVWLPVENDGYNGVAGGDDIGYELVFIIS